MTERGYWQHTDTGNIWAVETADNQPIRCAGPLDSRDIDQVLLNFLDYSRTYLYLLRPEWDSYLPLCSVCNAAID